MVIKYGGVWVSIPSPSFFLIAVGLGYLKFSTTIDLLLGLSPFLTEMEVFDSPSRTARLCEALWNFAHRSHTKLFE